MLIDTCIPYISMEDLIYSKPDSMYGKTTDKYGIARCHLNGNVRSVSSHGYRFDGRRKIIKKSTTLFLDRSGIERCKINTDENESLLEITNYLYDERDRLKEYFTMDSSGNMTNRHVYEYSNEGFVSYIEWHAGKKYCGKHSFKYDDRGYVVLDNWESRTPENRKSYWYKYDDNGRVIEMREFHGAYKELSRTIYTEYDINGHISKRYNVDADGSVKELPCHEYDSTGRIITFAGLYPHQTYRVIYDANNRVIEINSNFDNEIIHVLYPRDSRKIVILRLEKNGGRELNKTEVDFDDQQNVVSIITYAGQDMEPIEAMFYSYNYYNDLM